MKAVVATFNLEKALVGGLLRDYEPSDGTFWSTSESAAAALELQPYHLDTYAESYAAHLPLRYHRPEAAPGGGGESYQHNYVVKVGSRHITSTVYLATGTISQKMYKAIILGGPV